MYSTINKEENDLHAYVSCFGTLVSMPDISVVWGISFRTDMSEKIAIILFLEGCQIPGFPKVARYHLNKLVSDPQFSCLDEGLSFSPYPRCVLHWFIILEVVCESLNMHCLAGFSQTILARDLILSCRFLYCV